MSTIDLTTSATQLVKFGEVPSVATRISILNANLLNESGSLLYGTGNRLNTGAVGADNNIYQYAEVKALSRPSSTGSETNYGLINTKDGALGWAGIVTDFSGGEGKYLGAEVGKKIDDILHISEAKFGTGVTNAIQLGAGTNITSNSFQVFDIPVVMNGGIPFTSIDGKQWNDVTKSSVVFSGAIPSAGQPTFNPLDKALVAIGQNAVVYNVGGVAIGCNASCSEIGSVAVGMQANSQNQGVAIGGAAVARGKSIAIGYSADAPADSVVISPQTETVGAVEGAVIIGKGAKIFNASEEDARTKYSLAIGNFAQINGEKKADTSSDAAPFIQIGCSTKINIGTTDKPNMTGLSMNIGPYRLLNSDGSIPEARIPKIATIEGGITTINERLDKLGFKRSAATISSTAKNNIVVVTNTLQKMGKWVVFDLEFTKSSGYNDSIDITLPEGYRPYKNIYRYVLKLDTGGHPDTTNSIIGTDGKIKSYNKSGFEPGYGTRYAFGKVWWATDEDMGGDLD